MPEEIPLPYRIIALMQERNRLFAFPLEEMAAEIKATGFRCNCCGNCCTRAVNHHIFLLDHDIAELKKIEPTAYEPAPDPEFCDQNGTFYVSGYALRMKNDEAGSCWFLKNGRCQIYDQRFSTCRTYPHMLRRDTDTAGRIMWRQFAHPNEHGNYDPALSHDDSLAIARQIKEYENAFLNQQISFLETVHEYFTVYDLHHDAEKYQEGMERFSQGMPVDIHVFDNGELEKYRIAKVTGDIQ